jgi:hypothetical protein
LERETEREEEDREGEDRETLARDVLLMDRDEEEGLDDEIRLGELYLLPEEDLIRALDRLGVE